jgi:hypothetical protein
VSASLQRRVRELEARVARLAEFVTNISMGADGTVSSAGLGDRDLPLDMLGVFGLAARAMDGAAGVALSLGGEGNNGYLVGFRDQQYEPELEKGEVALYNAFGALVKLDEDGNIRGDAKAGKDIIWNGGGAKVARVGDTVKCGWLVFTPNVPPGGAASLAYLPPDTLPTPTVLLFPPPLVLLELVGKIDTGADHVKA